MVDFDGLLKNESGKWKSYEEHTEAVASAKATLKIALMRQERARLEHQAYFNAVSKHFMAYIEYNLKDEVAT